MPEVKPWISRRKPLKRFVRWYNDKRGRPSVYHYEKIMPDLLQEKQPNIENYPCVIPNFDNTPRCGKEGLVLHGSTPALFRSHIRQALRLIHDLPSERRIIFVKSWNEWAEGNHLEPDLKFGRGYLEVIREEIFNVRNAIGVPKSE
jgi:hypothetical protein